MIQDIDIPMQSTQPLDFITIMSLTWKLAAPFCYATAQLTFPAYLLAELPSFLPLHFFFLYTAIRRCLCFLSRTVTDTCTQYLLLGKKGEPHILTTSILTLTVNCWISKSVSLCPSQVLWRNGTLYKMSLACFMGHHNKPICKILYNDILKKTSSHLFMLLLLLHISIHSLAIFNSHPLLPFILQFLSESIKQRLPFLLCVQQLFKQNTKSLGNHLRNKDLTIGFWLFFHSVTFAFASLSSSRSAHLHEHLPHTQSIKN